MFACTDDNIYDKKSVAQNDYKTDSATPVIHCQINREISNTFW